MTEPVQEAARPVAVPRDEEYLSTVEELLAHPMVRSMENYIQHGDTSCLRHCINVSYLSYLYCKERGWNAREAARGGLLHDLFLYDWHEHAKQTGEYFHGYTHPRRALENADRLFRLTEREKEIILRHMWPLTVVPPRCREAYVIVMFDKYCTLMETFHKPMLRHVATRDFFPCPVPQE